MLVSFLVLLVPTALASFHRFSSLPYSKSQLQSQLSRPLVRPLPPESACYPPSSPSGNCSQVLSMTSDGLWRSDQPGSMQAPNWETFVFPNGTIEACYLNTTLGVPCGQGSVPIVGVDARTVEDVQAAVKFSKAHNLRLVIKNTGHDFLGRSTARGAFLLWTHHLTNITYSGSFVPEGGPPSSSYSALTLGAGVQWHDAYGAAQAQGRVIVGGISAGGSVGAAGGWVLGGGHSVLSPKYSLGVDNVLQFTMVDAAGDHLTINAYRYPDLFWALRGGGGGTYGVVTSVTHQTHPSLPVVGSFFIVNTTQPQSRKKIMTEFMRLNPALVDQGWGGYTYFLENSIVSFMLGVNVTLAQANETWNPFLLFAKNLTSEGVSTVAYNVPFSSFSLWYNQLFAKSSGQNGGNVEIGSRLIPRSIIESDPEGVVDTIEKMNVAWHVVAGGAVSQPDPDSLGLNPSWRSAVAHAVVGESWPEGTPSSTIHRFREQIKGNISQLDTLTTDSGAYFNEAFLYEENSQKSFFGSHYDKLKAIKDQYDPSALFIVAEGVGSDEWDASLNCRR